MPATIQGFERVFGKYKVISKHKGGNVELTTKVLAVKDWTDSMNFQVILNGKEEWLKYKHKKQDGTIKSQHVSDIVNALNKGDAVKFAFVEWKNPNTGKLSYFINDVVPEVDVNDDLPAEPQGETPFPASERKEAGPCDGFNELDPERQATELAEDAVVRKDTVAHKDNAPKREPTDMVRCNAMKSSSGTLDALIEKFGSTMKIEEIVALHRKLMEDATIPGARYLIENFFM